MSRIYCSVKINLQLWRVCVFCFKMDLNKNMTVNVFMYVCVILTSRLALVSRRATVWHLQVGLAAAAVLDGLWALGRRG